jgi:ankyrin repeat protein
VRPPQAEGLPHAGFTLEGREMFVSFLQSSFLAVFLSTGAWAADVDVRLPEAVINGDRAAVLDLLRQKADVNTAMPDGTTALHWAVRSDDLETTELLIRAGADVNVRNRLGIAPLYLACLNGNAETVRKLLDAGADPNAATNEGETALMTAARTGNPEAVRLLLDRGAQINARDPKADQTALLWAIREHHTEAVRLLLSRGADAKTPTKIVFDFPPETGNLQGIGRAQNLPKGVLPGGMTPLHYAAREGSLEVARMLIAAGAGVNQVEANGTSPLVVAILNNHLDVARFLLERGADVNTADGFGRTPLWSAVDLRNLDGMDKADIDREALLELAKTLLEGGANPNAQLKAEPPSRRWMFGFGVAQPVSQVGQTPVQRAALAGDTAAMRLLIEKGADPNLKSAAGTTALLAAAGAGWVLNQTYVESDEKALEAVKLAVEKGADVNAATSVGMTAMHIAARRGLTDIVAFLAENGAKADAKDTQGRTPLDYAENVPAGLEPNPQTIALLKKLAGEPATTAAQPRQRSER